MPVRSTKGEYSNLRGKFFTIFGAGGFVGNRLQRVLQLRGAQVWAPTRNDPLPWGRPLGHVMYCAGLTADYLVRPFDTVQAHVSQLAQLLQHGQWISLVYLSSTRLYDGYGFPVAREDAVLPMDPSNPRHLYDLSKSLGESLCHVTGQGRARVARLACVYECTGDSGGFLPGLLRQVHEARRAGTTEIQVPSSPHFVRDYVHLDDVVEALIRIVLDGNQVVYNLASGVNVSNAQIFDYIQSRWGCRVLPVSDTVPGPVPRVDIERLCSELHWQPRSLFDGLNACLGASEC